MILIYLFDIDFTSVMQVKLAHVHLKNTRATFPFMMYSYVHNITTLSSTGIDRLHETLYLRLDVTSSLQVKNK